MILLDLGKDFLPFCPPKAVHPSMPSPPVTFAEPHFPCCFPQQTFIPALGPYTDGGPCPDQLPFFSLFISWVSGALARLPVCMCWGLVLLSSPSTEHMWQVIVLLWAPAVVWHLSKTRVGLCMRAVTHMRKFLKPLNSGILWSFSA